MLTIANKRTVVLMRTATAFLLGLGFLLCGCGRDMLSPGDDVDPNTVPLCTDVTQAQVCPGQPRYVVLCQHAELVGDVQVITPRSGCVLSGLHGDSTADEYQAYCIDVCPL